MTDFLAQVRRHVSPDLLGKKVFTREEVDAYDCALIAATLKLAAERVRNDVALMGANEYKCADFLDTLREGL